MLSRRQRLESAHRPALAAQHQLADRPAGEVVDPPRKAAPDADARPQLLVDGLQARRNVDGVAIGRVVEETPAAEVPDNRGARMCADPRDAELDLLLRPALAAVLGVSIEIERAGRSADGVVRLLVGRA